MSFLTKEDKREARSIGWYALRWFLAVLVIGLVISGGLWALGVATAPAKGQGDAIQKKYSAENWTAAQARFEELYSDIVATDQKIAVEKAMLDADPQDPTLQTRYSGTVNYCLTIVGEYNAEARKFLSADFRAADLPEQISNMDPATDCK